MDHKEIISKSKQSKRADVFHPLSADLRFPDTSQLLLVQLAFLDFTLLSWGISVLEIVY